MSCKDISTYFSLFWKWKTFSVSVSSCRQQYQQSTDEFDEVSKSRPPIRSDANFLLGLWLAGASLTWENIVRGSEDLRSASIDIRTHIPLWVMLLSPIWIWWDNALRSAEAKGVFCVIYYLVLSSFILGNPTHISVQVSRVTEECRRVFGIQRNQFQNFRE